MIINRSTLCFALFGFMILNIVNGISATNDKNNTDCLDHCLKQHSEEDHFKTCLNHCIPVLKDNGSSVITDDVEPMTNLTTETNFSDAEIGKALNHTGVLESLQNRTANDETNSDPDAENDLITSEGLDVRRSGRSVIDEYNDLMNAGLKRDSFSRPQETPVFRPAFYDSADTRYNSDSFSPFPSQYSSSSRYGSWDPTTGVIQNRGSVPPDYLHRFPTWIFGRTGDFSSLKNLFNTLLPSPSPPRPFEESRVSSGIGNDLNSIIQGGKFPSPEVPEYQSSLNTFPSLRPDPRNPYEPSFSNFENYGNLPEKSRNEYGNNDGFISVQSRPGSPHLAWQTPQNSLGYERRVFDPFFRPNYPGASEFPESQKPFGTGNNVDLFYPPRLDRYPSQSPGTSSVFVDRSSYSPHPSLLYREDYPQPFPYTQQVVSKLKELYDKTGKNKDKYDPESKAYDVQGSVFGFPTRPYNPYVTERLKSLLGSQNIRKETVDKLQDSMNHFVQPQDITDMSTLKYMESLKSKQPFTVPEGYVLVPEKIAAQFSVQDPFQAKGIYSLPQEQFNGLNSWPYGMGGGYQSMGEQFQKSKGDITLLPRYPNFMSLSGHQFKPLAVPSPPYPFGYPTGFYTAQTSDDDEDRSSIF